MITTTNRKKKRKESRERARVKKFTDPRRRTHPDVMVVVVERLVPAALLHFGEERTSRRRRVAHRHGSVQVAAHTAHNLGFAEDMLGWKREAMETQIKNSHFKEENKGGLRFYTRAGCY